MNGYYISLIFFLGFVLALVFKRLVNEGFANMVHGMEVVLIVFGLTMFLSNKYDYYVLLILVTVSFREIIRVISDCTQIKKINGNK